MFKLFNNKKSCTSNSAFRIIFYGQVGVNSEECRTKNKFYFFKYFDKAPETAVGVVSLLFSFMVLIIFVVWMPN
jgi:hypothetical protein